MTRIDPKQEAGRISIEMTEKLGYQSMFSQVIGNNVFILWVKGNTDIMTCSSDHGTKYFHMTETDWNSLVWFDFQRDENT